MDIKKNKQKRKKIAIILTLLLIAFVIYRIAVSAKSSQFDIYITNKTGQTIYLEWVSYTATDNVNAELHPGEKVHLNGMINGATGVSIGYSGSTKGEKYTAEIIGYMEPGWYGYALADIEESDGKLTAVVKRSHVNH